jgi:hypothetical protein
VRPATQSLSELYGIALAMRKAPPAMPPVLSELQLDQAMRRIPKCIGATSERSAWLSKAAAIAYMDAVYKLTGTHCQIEEEQAS